MVSQQFPTQRGVLTYDSDALPEYSELSQLLESVARPFVLVSDRELSVLRRGLTKEGWKRSLYLQDAPKRSISPTGAGLLSLANQWLVKKVEIPGPSGRRQGFYCEDGTELSVPAVGSSNDYTCPVCGKVYRGESFDAALRWYRHNELSAACLALALVYQLDRDVEYARKAAEIILRYAEAYPAWCADGATGRMMADAVDEAAWIIPLAQSYDLIYHSKGLANGDREKIEEGLFRPAARVFDNTGSEGTDDLWQIAAQGVIGCTLRNPGIINAALHRLIAKLRAELGSDGVWPEVARDQSLSPLAAVTCFAEACSRFGLDLYDHKFGKGRNLRSMFLAQVCSAYPSFQLPTIGDSAYCSTVPLDLYEVAYRRWNDDAFVWVLRKGYGFAQQPVNEMQVTCRNKFVRSGLYAFLFGRDLPGRVQHPKLVSNSYPGIGICTLRSDSDVMLTLKYGRAAGDSHRDNLAVTLYANDSLLVSDFGAPGCGSEALGYWAETFGHNAVVVDGESQSVSSTASLSGFRSGEYFQLAEAESSDSYAGLNHKRRILLAGDIALIHDTLESDSEHTFDWLLRCEGTLECEGESSTSAETSSVRFSDAKTIGNGPDFAAKWCVDGSGLAGWFSSDASGEMITAKCPAETSARSVSLVSFRRRAGVVQYFTILVPFKCDAPIIERLGQVFKVTRGESVEWIYISDIPNDGVVPGLVETDAEVAAVREMDGKMVACGLYRGSYIRMNDENLLLGSGQFDWAEVKLDAKSPVIAFQGCSGGFLRLKCTSRAMRVNGHKISATTMDGMASIRIVGVLAAE